MMRAWISGIGLYASGLPDWQTSKAVLRGQREWEPQVLPTVHLPLPSAERRRTSDSTRVAWAAAAQALAAGGVNHNDAGIGDGISSVFVSSGGDGAILHQLCEALATPKREVSPTSFHNSVHNAPAGYFSIARHSHDPSTSVGAHPAPFAAGLLEAIVQVAAEQRSVLLVAYDLAAPFPLAPHWPAQQDFAIALLLTPQRDAATIAKIDAALTSDKGLRSPRPAWQMRWAHDNPMADCLPLLAAQARGENESLQLDYLNDLFLNIRWEAMVDSTKVPIDKHVAD